MGFALELLFSFSLMSFSFMVIYLYNSLVLIPQRIKNRLAKQGIRGPPPKFLYGNVPDMKKMTNEVEKIRSRDQPLYHDYPSKLFPYFYQWRKDYGNVFVYSMGTVISLYVFDPNLVKEMSLCKSLAFGKPTFLNKERKALFGKGIIKSNGVAWSRQRKIIAPEFYMDKLKGMVDLMVESAKTLLESWEISVEREGGLGNIRIDEDLINFSADVISRACFGSSFSNGREISQKLRDIKGAMSKKTLGIGILGSRFLPTKNNRNIWSLEKEIYSLIIKMVKQRQEDPKLAAETDLLKTLFASAARSGDFGTVTTDDFIVDNCKNIFFAGHESTGTTATWTLTLLAMNPEWQTRVRSEVLEVCGGRMPDWEMLRKMKILTMVIQESLRLYPPSPFVVREAFEDMKFGDLSIPAGTSIWVPLIALQQDPDIWGPDAHDFNPERFARGIPSACKFSHAYMPFGFGARTCVGQSFAMLELKVVLTLVLARFMFSPSPNYCHSPKSALFIEPQYGVNLLMKKVECQTPV